ncbi:hypothetical protein PF008_g14558 [Phytophthora fragariae]|uniref:Uncharacterized protein n=1 Tax=Phytophthora fragariae TaxID=53985 RepID=A0A6G0RGN6_9STRA|nr:hypothetical protein PF008_g14558 [Phytophthora fragariae]
MVPTQTYCAMAALYCVLHAFSLSSPKKHVSVTRLQLHSRGGGMPHEKNCA